MSLRARQRFMRLCTTTILAGALAAPALPATAQDGGNGPITILNRIVLGAGRDKVAINTPQAVTVLDQEDLDREQAGSINRIFENVPGVQGAGGDNPLGFAFNIRGIGATEQPASEARIIVNVDGVPKFYEQYRMGSFFSDVELYKQVEVLRGPASATLYGSGAIGGVVNFTTKDAADFLRAGNSTALRFRTAYDSNGDALLGSVIYATRFNESFELIGNLNYRTSDNYQDGDGTTIKGSDSDAYSGLAKGTYTFGNDMDQALRFSVQRTRSDIDDAPLVRSGGQSVIDVFGNVDRVTTDDTFITAYTYTPAQNPLIDLHLQLAWSDTSVSQRNPTGTCAPGMMAILCPVDYAYKTLQLKAENTFDLSTGAWENYIIAGVQFTRQDREAMTSIGQLQSHPQGRDEKTGVFARGEYIWNERLTIITGLRADFGARSPDPSIPGAADVSDTAISPTLAAHYKLNDNWGVFGSISQTERMPTLDELYSWDGPSMTRPDGRVPALDLDKETADTIEVGVTLSFTDMVSAGDSLQLKGTLFQNDIEHMIASNNATGAGPIPRFINIDNAEIWGGEVEGAYQAERWFGQLAYSHVKGRNKDTGVMLATIPAENVSLTLGGRLPGHGLEYGWRATYVASITTPAAGMTPATHFPSYDVHRLFARWTPQDGALEGFKVDFAVDNVFDATYRNSLYQDNGRGRTFQLALTKQLDW